MSDISTRTVANLRECEEVLWRMVMRYGFGQLA